MRTDYSLLEAALIGYQHQRETLAVKIQEIQRQLGGSAPTTAFDQTPKKRTMTEAAKKRIGLAQKKRWAEFHKNQGVVKKRVMSAEGRERIAEATRKRWAEFRANKAAAAAGKGGRKTRKAGAGDESGADQSAG